MLPKFRLFVRPIIRSFVRSFIVPIHHLFIVTIHRSSFVHTNYSPHYSPLLFIVTIQHRYYSSIISVATFLLSLFIVIICRRFETGGSLSRRVSVPRAPAQMGRARGRARRGESEVAGDGRERGGNPAAFVFVPRPGRVRLQ
jgi:hypothetical protein